MRENEILIIEGKNYREMTLRLLERADLIGRIPNRGMKIGIKPNLVSASEASWGATTHPEIVAGIIEYLQGRGCTNLVILESSWVGGRTAEAIEVCGYDRLSSRYGVPFWDMQEDKGVKRDCAGMELNVCERALAIDFLINVPVLKGHCQTNVTCALKNMKGLIPGREKRRFHSMGLHRPIAHLNAGLHQDFIVVDNICGDLDFEDGGNPVEMNRIAAAVDPVLTDAWACSVVGCRTDEVPYIGLARELGVGSDRLEQARVICVGGPDEAEAGRLAEPGSRAENGGGAAVSSRAKDGDGAAMSSRAENGAGAAPGGSADERLVQPAISSRARKIVALRDAAEEVDSCSACYGYLIPALDRLKQEGLLDKLGVKVCIGQGYRGKTGELGVGNCTAGFAHSLKGCPPVEDKIYRFLREYIEASRPSDGKG